MLSSARGVHSTLLLLPALQKWWLSNLVFLYLLSRLCPYCICRQLILVPCTFFVFCCLRRHLSRCKHCSRGSQAPACLASPRPFSFRVSVSSTRRRDWDGGPVSRSLAVPSAQWLPASLGFQVICVDSEQLSLGCRSLYPTCLIKNLWRGQLHLFFITYRRSLDLNPFRVGGGLGQLKMPTQPLGFCLLFTPL